MIYSNISDLTDLLIEKLSLVTETADNGEDLLLISKSITSISNISLDALDAVEAAKQAKASAAAAKESELKVIEIYNKFGNVEELIEEIKEIIANFGDMDEILEAIKEAEILMSRMYEEQFYDQLVLATNLIKMKTEFAKESCLN